MIATLSWWVLALIHLMPAVALARPALIETLYGVPAGSTVFLLQHRAALFVVVLLLCIRAAFRSEVRALSSVAVALSMVSFLALYALHGMPPELRLIAIADTVGLPFLCIVPWQAWGARAA